ncbi:CPBP family intramembrane glutamic endopeptidase [Virgibacillus halophilus]|uniref:CPBP family intramembrane glutamic endopeptidase n=1 Tax=Tigheibacillus halophilus TaxID=361280 RepID=UPI0036344A4A
MENHAGYMEGAGLMVFLSVFFVLIIAGYPLWDHFYMKKVNAGTVKKSRMYVEIMLVQWIALLVVWAYWLIIGRDFHIWFVFDQPIVDFGPSFWIPFCLGVIIVIGMIVGLSLFSKKRNTYKKSHPIQTGEIEFLFPSSPTERLLFFFVAVTAGICEEIIFRGVFYFYLSNLPFSLTVWEIGIISSTLFGLVHLYQGWKGVLATAYVGAVLYAIFTITGYLWPAIVFHILLDVKLIFLPGKKEEQRA